MIANEAVEAADAAYRSSVPTGDGSYQTRAIRAALEAAAPHIAAQVLEDAAKEIIAPGASSVASAWLNTRANMIRPTP